MHDFNIEEPDHHKFFGLVQKFWKHMIFLTPPTEQQKNISEEMGKINQQAEVRTILIFQDLKNIDNFIQDETKTENELYSLLFCLSDTFVEYLSNSERYGLLTQDFLQKFLNEEDHWIVLFYYILGKFPNTDSVMQSFLSYDFKRSIEESPFTEEIHVLLTCQSYSFPLFLSNSSKYTLIEME
jgi:hypothetical protein